ncbi:hypothetical protein BgAZ_103440 [Babesia gibsoni]|uniref:Uncharacterized protein n=1 Tax=Babesia gibsoni TaxID=33632 RepID=A0AAD8PFR8_BABGI|nr:hypothetical protein BgAZ_103440 [Babesia gibsoni]
MNGHSIFLSEEFMQDYCTTKRETYSKTHNQVDSETYRSCKALEYKLAACLSNFGDVIQKSVGAPDNQKGEEDTSRGFLGVLQCSRHFRDYEDCIRKSRE